MYSISNIKKNNLNFLELKNSSSNAIASISLREGASLKMLKISGFQVIEDLSPLMYKDTYASSILFPFANRVKDGKYKFKGDAFELECNEIERNNALHGLVYDKEFKCVKTEVTTDFASVKLEYQDDGKTKGFPFRFVLNVKYTLTDKDIIMSVIVKNKDKKAFPFTIGWHPYFKSPDLYNSKVNFRAEKQLLSDKNQITSDCLDFTEKVPLQIKNARLDDAYQLIDNAVEFITPDYTLKIKSKFAKKGFLQLYTPDKPNTIAIEPMTGVSDSFNNLIGLKILGSGNSYKATWKTTIKGHNTIDN